MKVWAVFLTTSVECTEQDILHGLYFDKNKAEEVAAGFDYLTGCSKAWAEEMEVQ